MKIFKNFIDLKNELYNTNNLGFVPTMGGLHKGHTSLIENSKKKCKFTLVSIFVNPAQFNKKIDFKKYPRNLKKDITILKQLKVDFLFLPNKKIVYKKKSEMKINIQKKEKILCAKYRPGHFEGVLAVINKFLLNIKANYIFLGEKDFQQIFLINKFINKKFMTKIILCKTVRDKNNIALSSRNYLLSYADLKNSSIIANFLINFKIKINNNFKNIRKIHDLKKKINKLKNIKLEYLEIRNRNNLLNKFNNNNFKIFIAYYNKNIRLIDIFNYHKKNMHQHLRMTKIL